MSSKLIDLNNLEKANQDYLHGLDLIQTSCIKCRCKPNYLDAIPYFKKAAEVYRGCGQYEKEVQTREKLVLCFNNEKSYWEEGNEYQKMCKTQITNLKKVEEAYISIINSFNSFAGNRTYDDGIKALTKASNDKYIDLLYDREKFNKSAEISEKCAELLKQEKPDEKSLICKYYGYWALSEIMKKNKKKFQEVVEKGMDFEKNGDNFCTRINKLINVINQKDKENESLIKKIFSEISRQVPSNMAKIINIKYIQVNIVKADEIKTNDDSDDDMK